MNRPVVRETPHERFTPTNLPMVFRQVRGYGRVRGVVLDEVPFFVLRKVLENEI